MSEFAFEIEGLSKSFEDNTVLKSIDLSVEKGTVIGMIGKNGAGKTTLIKCLLGILKPDEGDCRILDNSAWDLPGEIKHKIGYVPQIMSGFRWMKAYDLLNYTRSFYDNWNQELVKSLVKDWEVDMYTKVEKMSLGERQKLSIIMAMGHEPDLFILDEPVASLDPVSRRDFIKKIIDLNTSMNKTVLFSTHITSDLERVAADIIFLKEGLIDYKGDLSNLKDSVKRIKISGESDLPEHLGLDGIIHYESKGNQGNLTVKNFNDSILTKIETEFDAKARVEDLNLEEIFLEMSK